MTRAIALALAALAGAACLPQAAGAGGDVVIVVPVGRSPIFDDGVPRVRPTSLLKRYPFGTLREDYTPYGMPGVPDRFYFTAHTRNLR